MAIKLSDEERARRRVRTKHLVRAGMLHVGEQVYLTYGRRSYEGTILPAGYIGLDDGRVYRSARPAAEGMVIGSVDDGWKRLCVERDGQRVSLDTLRRQYLEMVDGRPTLAPLAAATSPGQNSPGQRPPQLEAIAATIYNTLPPDWQSKVDALEGDLCERMTKAGYFPGDDGYAPRGF